MTTEILIMRSLNEYPAGLIGTVSALFGRTIAGSHGVDWTLDAMIAEKQIEFFRRFDPERDRVWVTMESGCPRGALTIDGPRPEAGREAARLRFFILDESLRGRGLGRIMMAKAIRYCEERRYRRVFLTTLPGLEAAMRLYEAYGFKQIGESPEAFHGSQFVELTLEAILE
jgi:ribosomal protein S18 acetylase RimI-like enzyme